MNKSKCKGCQWNNKPYWSIINPCENCYRDEVQTITNWVDPTINQLQQENKQLKEKLNKISKFIKETSYKNLTDRWCFSNTNYAQNIIDIIENGDSNE